MQLNIIKSIIHMGGGLKVRLKVPPKKMTFLVKLWKVSRKKKNLTISLKETKNRNLLVHK